MEWRLSSEYSSVILLNRMSERLFCKEALWGKTSELLNKTVHLTLTPVPDQNRVVNISVYKLERFSFECRKVNGFALSTRCDWLKRFAPPFHPIRSKTKANCDALACIFPRFASATCNYFEF